MKRFIVITTINARTAAVDGFALLEDSTVVLVGDRKSKPIVSHANVIFLSVEDQRHLGYRLARSLPYDHYARKNIGYLYAIQNGADVIVDTDDDNIPYDFWSVPDFKSGRVIQSTGRFWNVYSYFTDEKVWPRGLPLNEILPKHTITQTSRDVNVGVWQGLADKDPDVDAIYRLVLNRPVSFKDREPIALEKHLYSPFNSQNTTWCGKAFPLMYLPATVSFRYTDILRGYIAQRLLWQRDLHLGFTKATVFQERNAHNLMKDFLEEVECYATIEPVVELLESIHFSGDLGEGIQRAYAELERKGFVKKEELATLEAWLYDVDSVSKRS